MTNFHASKELQYFQKLIVQNHYVKYLNNACDYWKWECEKRDTIIQMKDAEISTLGNKLHQANKELQKVNTNFKEFMKSVREQKKNIEKEKAQQEIIDQLKHELTSTRKRLEVRDKMIKLLEKSVPK